MSNIIYILISYLVYGAYLVIKDFTFRNSNTPMYVRNPDVLTIILALFNRPLNQNKIVSIYPKKVKMIGFIKLIIKLVVISFIIQFIINLF